ncbi:50S ribosomal protein L11 methyltransferase [Psychrosphaera sp. B3R10]|uniref:50S ribosomal protein L11 methyltransferase n=1 Tax=unclassified Psychrosphaera TaxID=2641570 RepID=UPI001C0A1AE9|nr:MULTISPECIES: 50S ribosomal protein L11 methyltransferase [unclassified Psychrosphaera]MBU2880354.1 50S ribosomal protein L11 methyltransferase [Psychrosphaera sp. I2R16]MBU2987793.1 50S ribosomal protein L11 methyltransferase [Psychrosphaera sp. B3R10]
MAWVQLRFPVKQQHTDEISDFLMDLGCVSVTFTALDDEAIFELFPGDKKIWQMSHCVGLFDAATDMSLISAALSQHSSFDVPPIITTEQVEDKDWEREWMDNFHAMQFGQRLWICPSWLDIPDPTACNVILDPGLAFGTGTHATTALCLEWLEGMDLTGKTVLDFGCGSGILAIAALKLGAKRAIGIDIDPKAITASLENAVRNKVEDQIELYLPEDAPIFETDVIVANILAGPLKDLQSIIVGYGHKGTELALSGILAEQADSVAAAYQSSVSLNPVTQQDEWVRIDGTIT